MALRNGVDTVGFVSLGIYTETYQSAADQDNINNLFASWGLLEEAPLGGVITRVAKWFWEFLE